MQGKSVHRIQDCVHGLMEFRGGEGVILDLLRTPELQRLRRIRQLGLAHLVFPGAEHSRLVHSLGAAYVAIRFGRHLSMVSRERFIPQLCPDEADVRDLAVAALCHDLGHGPLSHAWEREIVGEKFDRPLWASALSVDLPKDRLDELKWHELVGHGMLAWPEGQLHRLLEQHETGASQRISDLLLGDYHLSYWPRLINSDVDVDRADFVARDTHQTGVAYGSYDLDWMISTCTLGQIDGRWEVGFEERKAVRVIEQFLIARRALYETVYHHKTVRCAEGMMSLFLRRLRKAFQDGETLAVPGLAQPMVDIIGGKALSPDALLTLDDYAVFVLIDMVASGGGADRTLRDLANRLQARDLFKLVPSSPKQVKDFLTLPHAHEELYELIEPFCPGEADFYLVQDEVRFEMLSSVPEQRVVLVRESGDHRYAADHPDLRSHQDYERDDVRLFTIREASTAVARHIEARV